jgi:hypothetical protein
VRGGPITFGVIDFDVQLAMLCRSGRHLPDRRDMKGHDMKPMIPLRPLLWFDAVTCAAMGVLLAAGSGPLSVLLDLPVVLLTEAGVILMLFAVFVGWAATRRDPASAARLVIAANGAWVVGSAAVIAGPWLHPTGMGTAFVAVQAIAVTAIALLQTAAVARSSVSA